jgi:hypothetical protein
MNQLVFQHFYILPVLNLSIYKNNNNKKKNRWRQRRRIKPIFRHIIHSTSGQCCSFLMIGFVGSRCSPAGSSAGSGPLASRILPVRTAKKAEQNQPPALNLDRRERHQPVASHRSTTAAAVAAAAGRWLLQCRTTSSGLHSPECRSPAAAAAGSGTTSTNCNRCTGSGCSCAAGCRRSFRSCYFRRHQRRSHQSCSWNRPTSCCRHRSGPENRAK